MGVTPLHTHLQIRLGQCKYKYKYKDLVGATLANSWGQGYKDRDRIWLQTSQELWKNIWSKYEVLLFNRNRVRVEEIVLKDSPWARFAIEGARLQMMMFWSKNLSTPAHSWMQLEVGQSECFQILGAFQRGNSRKWNSLLEHLSPSGGGYWQWWWHRSGCLRLLPPELEIIISWPSPGEGGFKLPRQ